MAGKAIAKPAATGEFKIKCPDCGKSHLLSQISYDKCVLNNDGDDDFEIVRPVQCAAYLYPIFVCRNSRCRFDGTVSFPSGAV